MRLSSIGVLSAIAVLAACGQQSTAGSHQSPAPEAPSVETADARFLAGAAMYENYQIEAALIAASQGQSVAVKTYAANAASQHRAALQSLTQAAHSSGLAPPSGELNQDYRAYIDRLRNNDPTPFDARYASQQAFVTMSIAGRYDAFTSTAPDTALKQWAAARAQAVHAEITTAHQLAADVRAR